MKTKVMLCLGLALAGYVAPGARAERPGTEVRSSSLIAIASAEASAARSDGTPMQDADLAALRGGQSIVAGLQSLDAVTTGNALNGNYVSGAVTLSDNALSNFSGIGNFAINTGAQVSLQSGMNLIVNVGQ